MKWLVLAAWCWPLVARADYDPEWRDGCPPANFERAADHIAFSRSIDRPEAAHDDYNTDPHQVGVVPDFDSAFLPTRIAVLGTYSHFADSSDEVSPDEHDAATRARLFGGALQLHVNWTVADEWRLGASVTAGVLDRLSGDSGSTPRQLANIAFAPAIRHGFLTSFIHAEPGHTIAALRHGVALQGLVTASPTTFDAMERLVLMRHSAFDSYLYSPHRTWGGFFEYRIEGVGCYSPFIHLRLGGTKTTDLAGHGMWVLPESVAAGLAVAADASVFAQYSVLVAVGTNPVESDPILGSNVIHRFRIGLEWESPLATLGTHLDLFRGSVAYNGTVIGVYASLKPFAKGAFE